MKATSTTAAMAREAEAMLREEALGGGIVVALDPIRSRDVFRLLASRKAWTEGYPRLAGEWLKVALGLSTIELPQKDVFYGDRVWHTHPLFRRLAQAHLAFTEVFESVTSKPDGPWTDQERAAFVRAIVTGAVSPANFLPTNPAALREAIDTRGASLMRGLRNFLVDLGENKGMPSMVDSTPYHVGENLACTPGKVVYREELFEILQYEPQTPDVHARPLLFVPPQVNKFYVLDLAPGRSMVEYAVQNGLSTFMLVWRNPREDPALRHGSWGLELYTEGLLRAIEVVKAISGADDLNAIGLCAGGMTTAFAQSYLAGEGDGSIANATYIVTMLDPREPNMVTGLGTEESQQQMARRSEKATVINSKTMAANFAWMRPKDLVFNYVINNWLMGKRSPAFDVLSWNADATNVSSTFARDTQEMLNGGAFTKPGTMTLLGRPVDLKAVTTDAFLVAGQRDHITTWRPCFMTTQVHGGETEVVIVNSGHIQTFVNPVKGSRYKYWTGPGGVPNPDEWLATADQVDGSWWPKWLEWVTARSGPKRRAPQALGSAEYPPMEDAPGLYVHEK
ncbi:PHA/PHB synthase family protein [Cumulibacter manganitolerans]|uniref:PHA/PHB synthase family protein n=1 Tax=Cumulibacter manganitolerans TaxID=1884992 RepID=UPI0012981F62|nr:poly-beta-hydroxybutyrate polymerase [Cumulibacter manganitolerans]